MKTIKMDKKLINEEISNMKYLLGYKPGKVISEQEQPEMKEDNDNLFVKRRLSTIEELIDKYIKMVEDDEEYVFSDEYSFASNIISWVINALTKSDDLQYDYDEIEYFIKENYGEYILSQYVERDFDDDEDYDDDEDDF
jgi:hypothetical protein